MSTIKIIEAKKQTVVKDGERFLEVHAEIHDGDIVKEVKRGFPLSTPVEEIRAEMQKTVELYDAEKAHAVENAEAEEAESNADEAICELVGLEITSAKE